MLRCSKQGFLQNMPCTMQKSFALTNACFSFSLAFCDSFFKALDLATHFLVSTRRFSMTGTWEQFGNFRSYSFLLDLLFVCCKEFFFLYSGYFAGLTYKLAGLFTRRSPAVSGIFLLTKKQLFILIYIIHVQPKWPLILK